MAINYNDLYNLIYDTSGEVPEIRQEWLSMYEGEVKYATKEDAIKHGVVFTEDDDFVYQIVPYTCSGGSAALPMRVSAEYVDDGYVVKNIGVVTRNTISEWMSSVLKCYNIDVKDTVSIHDKAQLYADAYEHLTGNDLHGLTDEEILAADVEDKLSFLIGFDGKTAVQTVISKFVGDTYYNYLIDNYKFGADDYTETLVPASDNYLIVPKPLQGNFFKSVTELMISKTINYYNDSKTDIIRGDVAQALANLAGQAYDESQQYISEFITNYPSHFYWWDYHIGSGKQYGMTFYLIGVDPSNPYVSCRVVEDGNKKYNSYVLSNNPRYLQFTVGIRMTTSSYNVIGYIIPTSSTTGGASRSPYYGLVDKGDLTPYLPIDLIGTNINVELGTSPFSIASSNYPKAGTSFDTYISNEDDPWPEVDIDDDNYLPVTLNDDDYPPRSGTPTKNLTRPVVEQPDPPAPDPEDEKGTEVPEEKDLNYDGFVHIYNPSDTVLNSFNEELWDDGVMETLKKWWNNNPMDGVVSLHRIYIQPNHVDQNNYYITLGKFKASSSCLICKRERFLDLGNIEIPRKFNDVRDFESKVTVYLPFVGFRELDVVEVMGGSIHIIYRCDIATGDFLVTIGVNRTGLEDDKVLYTYEGNCSVKQPLSSSDRTGLIGSAASTIAKVGKSIASGNALGVAGSVAAGAMDIMNNVAPTISRSSNMSGSAGAYGYKKPYVIVERPYTYDAKNYNDIYGYPSNTTVNTRNLIGYNKFKKIHVDNIYSATDEEKNLIETMLTSGVIF